MHDPLEDVKAEIISAWERMSAARGTSPLMGRILGVLYVTGEPLSQREISRKVGYELSAVSQALSILLGTGAVRRIKKSGERTGYYEPNTPVATMVSGTLAHWLEAEKAFHSDIKQQIRRLKELKDTTAKKDETKRLLQVLDQMDSALQGLITAFQDAFAKIERTL